VTQDEATALQAAAVAAAESGDKAALALGDDAAQANAQAGLWTFFNFVTYTKLSNIDRVAFWASGGALESLATAAGKGVSPSPPAPTGIDTANKWVTIIGASICGVLLFRLAFSRRSRA
jgi:hypothetical protein